MNDSYSGCLAEERIGNKALNTKIKHRVCLVVDTCFIKWDPDSAYKLGIHASSFRGTGTNLK